MHSLFHKPFDKTCYTAVKAQVSIAFLDNLAHGGAIYPAHAYTNGSRNAPSFEKWMCSL